VRKYNVTNQQPLDVEEVPPPAQPPNAKIFSALDHYNAAAAGLQEIVKNHENEEFGIQDAMVMIDLARTHAELGRLKLELDIARKGGGCCGK
jgi:hypothetical protein